MITETTLNILLGETEAAVVLLSSFMLDVHISTYNDKDDVQ